MVFAQCIDHNRPDLKIFEYRDGILLKAVSTLLQLAYDGRFMRFNDALLKATTRRSLVYAVNIAYNADPSNKTLLDVAARYQDWGAPDGCRFCRGARHRPRRGRAADLPQCPLPRRPQRRRGWGSGDPLDGPRAEQRRLLQGHGPRPEPRTLRQALPSPTTTTATRCSVITGRPAGSTSRPSTRDTIRTRTSRSPCRPWPTTYAGRRRTFALRRRLRRVDEVPFGHLVHGLLAQGGSRSSRPRSATRLPGWRCTARWPTSRRPSCSIR